MTTNLPLRQRNIKVEIVSGKKDRSNMFDGLLPTFTTLIVTAIFYYTGWVYISHWYSYFGIDASQTGVPLQLILLHGFPGVLFLAASGLIAFLLITFYKEFFLQLSPDINDLPAMVITAYLISLLGMFVFVLNIWSVVRIPAEVWISSAGLLLLGIAYQALSQVKNVMELVYPPTIPMMTNEGKEIISPARLNIILRMIGKTFLEKGFREGVKSIFILTLNVDETLSELIDKAEAELKQQVQNERDRLVDIIKRSWRFWIFAIVIFYFLISISSSALLGEWDAARGGRFMNGDWHIPEVSIFSASSIPALGKFENKISVGFEYKPLGLLASDDNAYYLVDWKTTNYYTTKPNVYIIPRADSLTLNLIVSPYITPTPTPMPTTNTPTSTPTVTTTPTP